MTKYNRPNGKLFGSSATNIGVFGSGQQNETPTNSTDPNTINTLGTHWEQGWDGAVVSQAPYTAPYINDMNAVNYVNSYNSAYLLQRGIAEYSSTEEYQQGSLCVYNNEIWMCKLDGTSNVTPTEGTYWHQQAELPVMSDNEVLVGSTGVGATVTDTLNQGDIIATTSGLDVKAGVITNTHISSQAGDKIAESKLNLAYTTTTLNTNIGNVSTSLSNHTSSTTNPHQTTVSNLDDTNISGSLANEDTLIYDGVNSEWINLPNTIENLKNTTITSVSSGDTLSYDGSKWINQEDSLDNLTNTTITSANSGDALTYNGTKWINKENSLTNLTDTALLSPSSGDALIYDGSDWINQENSVDNLTNTTITSATSGDTLSYNGSAWINQENSLDNLTNTTITTVSSGDALTYDGSKWINKDNSLANLTDTTITTPSSGEILKYDGSKWINDTPPGGAISTLSDVALTTPLADGEILTYDTGSSKWENSNIIEINNIAKINTATTNITLTATDNRHQIFTATDGFNITLPSTGIKAGDKFVFDWKNDFGLSITSPFIFYGSDGVSLKDPLDNTVDIGYAWINNFQYTYTAMVDNPTSEDWMLSYKLARPDYHVYQDMSSPVTNAASIAVDTATLAVLKAGIYDIRVWYSTDIAASKHAHFGAGLKNVSIPTTRIVEGSTEDFFIWIESGYFTTTGSLIIDKPYTKTAICKCIKKLNSISGRINCAYTTTVSGEIRTSAQFDLIRPYTDNSIT